MEERFSPQHPFSRFEVEDAQKAVFDEGKSRGLLIRVTTGYRSLALRQFVANVLAFVAAISMIFATAYWEQPVDAGLLRVWLLVAVGSWLIRMVAYYRLFKAPPAQVARRMALRLIPLAMVSMSTAFWIWTITLLIGPTFTATAAVLLMGLLALSVAMIGMWPTTPVAAASQLALVWLTVAVRMIAMGVAPWPLVLGSLGMLGVTLWAVVYVSVSQVRPHLQRSDQVDLLVAELREANETLEALKNELWATLSKRSAFFASASHDFRQCVHAFKLLVGAATQSLEEGHPSRRSLQRVLEELDEMEGFMTDVLDFARIEAVDTAPQLAVVVLQRVFQRVELQLEPVAEATNVDLKLRLTKVWLKTDGAMLHRMLENLVSNAVKFTRGRVLVAARMRAEELVIEVWDQGPGIDEAERSKIFEAFYQSESKAPERRGIGLGLAIVRRFAGSLGYQVTVESRVGRGSVFRVHVPGSAVIGVQKEGN